jgi:hypothetical protein
VASLHSSSAAWWPARAGPGRLDIEAKLAQRAQREPQRVTFDGGCRMGFRPTASVTCRRAVTLELLPRGNRAREGLGKHAEDKPPRRIRDLKIGLDLLQQVGDLLGGQVVISAPFSWHRSPALHKRPGPISWLAWRAAVPKPRFQIF